MIILKKLFFIGVIVFLFFSLTKNLFDYQKNLSFYRSVQQNFEKAKKTNIELQTELLKKKDPYLIEKSIRNNLNMTKPGETLIILPSRFPTPASLTPTPAPNWRMWWKMILK